MYHCSIRKAKFAIIRRTAKIAERGEKKTIQVVALASNNRPLFVGKISKPTIKFTAFLPPTRYRPYSKSEWRVRPELRSWKVFFPLLILPYV